MLPHKKATELSKMISEIVKSCRKIQKYHLKGKRPYILNLFKDKTISAIKTSVYSP